MKATLELERGMRLAGFNELGLVTYFDTHVSAGGDESAATPMEIVLQAAAACSTLDILSMLKKRKKTVERFRVIIDSERAAVHPKVFTKIKMIFELKSPDVEMEEFKQIISLSQDKYCSVSIMLKRAGCDITWEAKLSK